MNSDAENSSEVGRHLDIVSGGEEAAASQGDGRRWLGVYFECCGVYARLYRAPSDQAYNGRCPSCCTPITIKVGPEGVNQRILRAVPVEAP